MRAKIQKSGDDLVLRIPDEVAEVVGLTDGGEVELSVENGRLVVAPPRAGRLSFEEMCARVTDENRHGEIDTGPAAGNEAW
ncbi:MAG TPA: AbrB/MazE/SpoVT family DNA-binding domain-containing protein [Longimicrobiaceae bacterium]